MEAFLFHSHNMHNPDYYVGTFAARLLKGTSRLPRILLLDVAVLLIIFGITLLLQWASGAHFAALGAEPDEASHYVTGVMIRDYLNVGLLHNPITFAEEFYLHYPRVGFGLWPPLFHLFSGAWMLAFGTDRMSVMFMPQIADQTRVSTSSEDLERTSRARICRGRR